MSGKEPLIALAKQLAETEALCEKQKLLFSFPQVQEALIEKSMQKIFKMASSPLHCIVILSLAALDEHHGVFREATASQIEDILNKLATVETFYHSLGGLVGYHITILQLLNQTEKKDEKLTLTPPSVLTIDDSSLQKGLQALPKLAEIFPIGGVGERLALKDAKGSSLPAALLPFLGRSLLEGLLRDTVSREYLYFKLTSETLTLPIAIMTSLSEENHKQILALFENNNWFGRPKESFKLFSQPHVPVVTVEGHFSMKAPGVLNLKPGGHGALWRVAEENQIFDWFKEKGASHLLIRQINNPLASQDYGLIAFLGAQTEANATFGFASCERRANAAEGALVLCECPEKGFSIRNVEYTEFTAHGLDKKSALSQFPTNTNVLYAHMPKIQPVLQKSALPGLMLNMKSQVPFTDKKGRQRTVLGGRLESMMQNISDVLHAPCKQTVPTYVTYSKRAKLMSAAKKKWDRGKPLLETPEGAYYDLQQANHTLLKERCGVDLPSFCVAEEYLKQGPSSIFLYHPALGPLYSIISQKIQGGAWSEKSELQLEIAELLLKNLTLNGSLLIEAENGVGHLDNQGRRVYSDQSGRLAFFNVTVQNKGIDRAAPNLYWKNAIQREERCQITLKGCSAFYAEEVTLKGNQQFIVPDGERWILTPAGLDKQKINRSTPLYRYSLDKGRVALHPSVSSPLSALLVTP